MTINHALVAALRTQTRERPVNLLHTCHIQL